MKAPQNPSEALAARVRRALAPVEVSEQRMFGGVCFMLGGNMLVGTGAGELLVRVGKEGHQAAMARGHARPMIQRGRAMIGYLKIDPEGTAGERDLRAWLDLALAHVQTLPAKTKPAGKPRATRI